MKDSAILRRGLEILEGMVRSLEDGNRIDIADVAAILKVFRSLEHIEEQVLVEAMETALVSRKGVEFVRTSRQLTLALRSHLEEEGMGQERAAAAGGAMNETLTEKFVNLTHLEYKYAAKAPGAAKPSSASVVYRA